MIRIANALFFALLSLASVAGQKHLIYSQSNSDDPIRGNEILALHHDLDTPGKPLTVFGRFPTGGVGSSSPIGSQDSMIVHNNRLLSVNAISNDISVFDMDLNAGGSLTLVDLSQRSVSFQLALLPTMTWSM